MKNNLLSNSLFKPIAIWLANSCFTFTKLVKNFFFYYYLNIIIPILCLLLQIYPYTVLISIIKIFLLYIILKILHFLVSKVDFLLKKKKEFVYVEKRIFIKYIIKYLIIIISVSFIIVKLTYLFDLNPNKIINTYNIIFYYNTVYWINFILIFYIFIYLKSRNIFSNLYKYIPLYLYRVCIFIILRSILIIVCPEEYSIFLTQGLLSIIFPDIFSNIYSKIISLFEIILEKLPIEDSIVYADSTFEQNLKQKYREGDPRRDINNYRGIDSSGSMKVSMHSQQYIETLFYRQPSNNIFTETFVLVNGRHNGKVSLFLLNINELHYMSSVFHDQVVKAPGFTRYYFMDKELLPPNHTYVEYKQRPFDTTIYKDYLMWAGEINIPNYHMRHSIYIMDDDSNRIVYDPTDIEHANKRLFLKENNISVYIGNSGPRRFDLNYVLKETYANQLRQKYNIKKQ